jgi:tetratricopeptide (TPR) repeat protein
VEPTSVFTFVGYVLPPEILTKIIQKPENYKDLKDLNKSKILLKLTKSLGYLEKFAQVFQFAQPRLHLWKGALLQLNGKEKKAQDEWNIALEISRNLSMKYEEAFVLYHRGVFGKKTEDLTEACKIFPQIKTTAVELNEDELKRLTKKKSNSVGKNEKGQSP